MRVSEEEVMNILPHYYAVFSVVIQFTYLNYEVRRFQYRKKCTNQIFLEILRKGSHRIIYLGKQACYSKAITQGLRRWLNQRGT